MNSKTAGRQDVKGKQLWPPKDGAHPYSGSLEERRAKRNHLRARKAREKRNAEREKLKHLLDGVSKWPKLPPEWKI